MDTNLNCSDGGIYVIDTTCTAQYTGKTVHYGARSNEHFLHGGTAISPHIQNCDVCNNATMLIGASIPFLRENTYGIVE